jgi:hypothetical protein
MQVVIDPPRLDLAPRVFDRQELVDVQAFVAQLAVERLDKAVLRRLSRSDEVERDTASIGPLIQRSRRELRAVIDGDRPRRAVPRNGTIEGLRARVPADAVSVTAAAAVMSGTGDGRGGNSRIGALA